MLTSLVTVMAFEKVSFHGAAPADSRLKTVYLKPLSSDSYQATRSGGGDDKFVSGAVQYKS